MCNRDFKTDGMPHGRHLSLHYKDRGRQYMKIIMVIVMRSRDEAYKTYLMLQATRRICLLLRVISYCAVLVCVILVSIRLCFFVFAFCGCFGVISA
jgi:hypothetical protein